MWNDNPREVQKNIFKKSSCIAVILMILSLLTGDLTVLLGVLLGHILSCLLFRLKLVHIERALDLSSGKAESFMRNRFFINYFLYFVSLYGSFKNPRLDFAGVVFGLLLIKFTIVGMAVVNLIEDRWKQYMKRYEKGGGIDEWRN